jgi:hypothetical protein
LHVRQPTSCSPRLSILISARLHWLQRSDCGITSRSEAPLQHRVMLREMLLEWRVPCLPQPGKGEGRVVIQRTQVEAGNCSRAAAVGKSRPRGRMSPHRLASDLRPKLQLRHSSKRFSVATPLPMTPKREARETGFRTIGLRGGCERPMGVSIVPPAREDHLAILAGYLAENVLDRAVAQPPHDNQYTCELDVPAFCCAVREATFSPPTPIRTMRTITTVATTPNNKAGLVTSLDPSPVSIIGLSNNPLGAMGDLHSLVRQCTWLLDRKHAHWPI